MITMSKRLVKYNHVTETKAYRYAYDVLEGNIIASKDVINACERFMMDIERHDDDSFPYYLDLDQCARIENVASCFKHTKGFMANKVIELADVQSFILANLYAFRYKVEPTRKRFSTAFLMLARKNAKSFLAGMLAMLELIDSKDEPEVYTVATMKEQAKICYEQTRSLIASNPKVAKKFALNRSEIRMKANNGIFKALASESNNLDGSSPSLAIIDEAMVTKEGVRSAMVTGTGQRRSSLVLCITTSYDVSMTNNWCYDEYMFTKRVNDANDPLENDKHFGMVFQLDSESELDDIEKYIVKANPLAQTSEFLKEKILESYEKAKTSSTLMRTFKVKHCNLIMENKSSNGYIPMSAWQSCAVNVVNMTRKPVFFGIDMAITTDLCGVSVMSYDEYDGKFITKSHAFLPGNRIHEAEVRDNMNYRQLAEDGYITLVNGDVIQARIIYDWIKDFITAHDVTDCIIGYDRYSAEEVLKLAEADGLMCVEVRQGYALSQHIKSMREDIFMGKIAHENNPILNWCMGNVVTKKDAKFNEQFDKVISADRIDLAASTLFSYYVTKKLFDSYFGRLYDDMVF